ncbi:hypothetical protein [Streptomyces sp. TRM68367]|uniref:hypothetical protein n=1 Tax=Streptomyces sp. TRM68367 TaxID=2758415 RepID=UPI00165CE7F9|nr:hypothetical protein [Streptomyces sp. TRM68367]MBC9729215.1 hypothetical protein [Streptomyces sp. TRM68367]
MVGLHLNHLTHGLRASLRNNGQAYGFSVSITVALALLDTEARMSGVAHIIYFALGAATAFSILELLASRTFHKPLEQEPSTVMAMGVSLSVVSVGTTSVLAWASAHLIGGVIAWPVTAFLVSVVYSLVAGVELAIAQRAQEASSHGGEIRRKTVEEEEERRTDGGEE